MSDLGSNYISRQLWTHSWSVCISQLVFFAAPISAVPHLHLVWQHHYWHPTGFTAASVGTVIFSSQGVKGDQGPTSTEACTKSKRPLKSIRERTVAVEKANVKNKRSNSKSKRSMMINRLDIELTSKDIVNFLILYDEHEVTSLIVVMSSDITNISRWRAFIDF